MPTLPAALRQFALGQWALGVSITLVAVGLAACGGGGGGSTTPPVTDTPPPALPAERMSANTLVASGCTGGATSGVLNINAEVEPFVAVHPGNPQILAAAWQQDRWSNGGSRALVTAVSRDGGSSWSRTLMPFSRCGGAATGSAGDYERASDPWVDIGPTGVMYAMALSFTGDILVPGSASALLASRSTDNGQTWSPPVTLQRDGPEFFNDKNAVTADPTDARYVFATWDRLDAANFGPTMMARSVDSGVSWEPARTVYLPTAAGGVSQTLGNRIVVLKNGTLVNLFTQIDTVGTRSTTRLAILRSSDKGATWSTPVFIAEVLARGASDPQTGKAIRDGATLGSIAAGNGNDLWVTWQDARFSGGVRDAIAVAHSSDGGLTWSTPVAINRFPSVAAFTPSIAIGPTGTIAVSHYDLRPDTADASTLLAGAWLLTSRDGITWTESTLWSPFDLANAADARGLFLGDYQGLVAVGNSFLSVLGLSSTDTTNRSDIYAIKVPGG